MTKLLVVVGATGSQGRAVINFFRTNEPTWKIRGITRDPSSLAATALVTKGVEMVEGNLSNVGSLQKAFEGANYIFAYTDFGTIVKSPDVLGKFMAGQLAAPIGAECFKIETQHGRNIADAAATVRTLERLVWSADPAATKLSNGKYTQIYNFDAKAVVTEYMLSLDDLHDKVSTVQLGIFVTNAITKLELFAIRMADGTASWETTFPADKALPYVDVEKDLGGFVSALIKAPAPTQVAGVSEWMTGPQFLDLFSQVTGVKSDFVNVSPESILAEEDPTGFKPALLETAQFVAEYSYFGRPAELLMPEDLNKMGYPVSCTKIADYMAREDWSELVTAT